MASFAQFSRGNFHYAHTHRNFRCIPIQRDAFTANSSPHRSQNKSFHTPQSPRSRNSAGAAGGSRLNHAHSLLSRTDGSCPSTRVRHHKVIKNVISPTLDLRKRGPRPKPLRNSWCACLHPIWTNSRADLKDEEKIYADRGSPLCIWNQFAS
jgi:hypothetical protein